MSAMLKTPLLNDLAMREAASPEAIQLYRLDGRWEDAQGMSYVDTGYRSLEGHRVYSDGLTFVTRAGIGLRSLDIDATELTGGKA